MVQKVVDKLLEHHLNFIQRDLVRAETEAKFWFEMAHWLVLVAVFQYAQKVVHTPSFGAGLIGLSSITMRGAVVTILSSRLFIYVEKPITWAIRKIFEFGFVDFESTVTRIRFILLVVIWLFALWAISSAVNDAVEVMPSRG